MAPSGVLLAFLQLCSLQLLLVSMPTKCRLPRRVVNATHFHLTKMGGEFPLRCLPYNANMSFPYAVVPAAPANHSQCRRALWVGHESLRQAELLFQNELPAGVGGVNWNETELENFRNLQDRVVKEGHFLSSVDTSGVLSPYFSNVTAVIKQQDACGWEVLRRDLLWVLKTVVQRHHACFKC